MYSKGVHVSLNEFHSRVNTVFHAFESAVYDRVHAEMWETLPRHFNDLAQVYASHRDIPASLSVLDVGCGTGLSSQLLLQTCLGNRIRHIDLLDTSPEMLRRCGDRPQIRGISHRLLPGMLDVLPPIPAYDLIVACSVLHHIPDLRVFLNQLSRLQRPEGAFLHLQDPNGDYLHDAELIERRRRLDRSFTKYLERKLKRFTPRRIVGRLQREVTGRKENSYIDRINDELLSSGIIHSPMTESELWSVTDIHVYNGRGISIKELSHWLTSYRLVCVRSYSFFGAAYSELPSSFQKEEDRLLRQEAPNGQHIGAIWMNTAGGERLVQDHQSITPSATGLEDPAA
jgi:SAM-dependent methyltransferase